MSVAFKDTYLAGIRLFILHSPNSKSVQTGFILNFMRKKFLLIFPEKECNIYPNLSAIFCRHILNRQKNKMKKRGKHPQN
jgi:hypothetical protein